MGFKHNLFSDYLNITTIDCMGRKVSAKDFCYNKLKEDKTFIRAFVDKSKSELVCQKGHNVLLTVSCDDKDLYYCSKSARKGCLALQKHFAINHELIHFSILREKDIHKLHCYFSANLEIKE